MRTACASIPYIFVKQANVPDLTIESPEDARLDELCTKLSELAPEIDGGAWPAEQLRLCAEFGVFRWFLDSQWGGTDWPAGDIVRGYLKLSAACLTTTFVITQRTGACRRIAPAPCNYPRPPPTAVGQAA